MGRPGTDRLKFKPPLGTLPVLQYVLPAQLQIDAAYQRSLEGEQSQTLVRGIAQYWNWDLCQPLVVARRPDGKLYVIDGQHRLAAARMRGDIAQLPAVVVQYETVEDEAASFVLLNQQRKPLSKLDLFKAAVASGDTSASAIVAAMDKAGLRLAPHTNFTAWKPGMVSNIAGIEACWRGRGALVTELALKAMAQGFKGQVLRYAGTIFPGIAALIDFEVKASGTGFGSDPEIWDMIVELLGDRSQEDWRKAIMEVRADEPSLNFARASERALLNAWRGVMDLMCDFDGGSAGEDKGEDAAGSDDAPDGEDDPDDLGSEMAKQWEDLPDPGDLAEVVAAPAVAAELAPDPDVLTKRSAAQYQASPLPSGKGPKKPGPVDWGKVTSGKPKIELFKPDAQGKCWCKQHDRRVTRAEVQACRDKRCPFGGVA